MRISDWSSDVCSSDLAPVPRTAAPVVSHQPPELAEVVGQREAVEALIAAAAGGHHLLMSGPPGARQTMIAERLPGILPDRQRVVSGKSVSVRVDLGGSRLIQTTNNTLIQPLAT